jgi:hypothetical protein
MPMRQAASGWLSYFFLDAYQLQRAARSLDFPDERSGSALQWREPDTTPHPQGALTMSTATPSPDFEEEDEPIPVMQQLLDNPFLLLFLGIAMPTVLYIIWGVMEIVGIPIAK